MAREGTKFEGGYYFLENDLIRTGIHSHTAALPDAISDTTLEGVNLVQKTAWQVNGWVLDVMLQAFQSGMEVGDMPYHDALPIPRKTDEEWEAMDAQQQADWKRELSYLHGHNARLEGRRKGFASKVSIAIQMRDEPQIFFPHFVDFRGRIYPMPQDLHPQSDDLGKSLLRFAEGKRVGARGLYWLAVRLANTFGQDKLPLDARVDWVRDNSAAIFDSAENPLDGGRFWEEADEPFCFLATCREWADAWSLENPEDFVSYLPVQQDGSCNGLQHLSAMGRDPVGAVATNVAANDERQDIYQQVANRVMGLISDDAAAGNEAAHQWVGKIDRKVVKRAVMTTPYGVTPRGIADQLIQDGHTKGMEKSGVAANYLRDKITQALDETVVSAKQIMHWLQETAAELSRHNVPFRFTTPTGNVIQQSYFSVNQTRIRTLFGQLAIWKEEPVSGLNDRKQFLAAAPNLIHSFDASHLVMTARRMAREIPDVSFSMIHDSFGCHACDVDDMGRILREEFVSIYQSDWLARVEEEVRSYAPDIEIPSYTDFVTMGDFDVTEVLESDFFFA